MDSDLLFFDEVSSNSQHIAHYSVDTAWTINLREEEHGFALDFGLS